MKALHIILTILMMAVANVAAALPLSTYTDRSVLASGRWVQVSVSETGMHRITTSQLSQWGFRDPSKVRIHGYGGTRISDVLSASTYVDDLPAIPSIRDASGIIFFAVGPVQSTPYDSQEIRHQVNPYSNFGYYYITESSDSEAPAPEVRQDELPADAETTPYGAVMLVHEKELSTPGGGGRMMLGEDFRFTRTQAFDFTLTDRIPSTLVRLRCSFVASVSAITTLDITANGVKQPADSYEVIAANRSDEVYGNQLVAKRYFRPEGQSENLRIGLTHNTSVTPKSANLDFIEVVYDRRIAAPRTGSMVFHSAASALSIAGADSRTRVWDVTDATRPEECAIDPQGRWAGSGRTQRRYVAFSTGASLPQPRYVATVANQNLHSLATPDMVIITHSAYSEAARQLAELHRNDTAEPMTVEVVTLDKVLHEFGSGSFDPGAIRRFLKMLYDRGPLRYAIIMGKGTYDNRALTGVGRSLRSPVPLWQSETSLSESGAFSTDDIIAFLEDGSGNNMGSDKLSIALGRIPCTTAQEALLAVDKIVRYREDMPRSTWRNHVLILADDGNKGDHMHQSEAFVRNLNARGSDLLFSKVYIDAYKWQNGSYPVARSEFYRHLNDGAMFWTYIGHGSPTALCGDNMVTYQDMTNQFYLRHWPFCYAATCSFLKWDTDQTSAAEMLYFNPDGGLVGVISALRPVYISLNGDFSAAMGNELTDRDDNGNFRSIGEIYRRAKNRLTNDTNRLRFVFMGDPALRLALPSARVRIDSIGGQPLTPDAQLCLPARGHVAISGSVLTPDGRPYDDFNGELSATLYDADKSVESFGYGKDGEKVAFDIHGDMLLTTRAKVTGGRFSFTAVMPADIAFNFRPASLNLYAFSDTDHASGVCRDLYVWGYDDTAPDDVTAPVIHTLALNRDEFSSGGTVNATPMLLATVSDDTAINLSSTGIGHQISVSVDGATAWADVNGYFTPHTDPIHGAMSGTIAYPMPTLSEGAHTVRLRVWDLAGNYAERSVECVVDPSLSPAIVDVYTDANPATDAANFYVIHDRPDQRLEVSVTVYNLLGQPVWTGSTSGRSDMHTSSPLRWDLTDTAGRRVGRGIYLYRATVKEPGGNVHASRSRKLAVSAQ
ncbi:MAG: type IX secretion system sortase PorU [Muribaculaceae bacterium]|nr:type IX secretion system sortase PorU [Muribaculaceae bacterium]